MKALHQARPSANWAIGPKIRKLRQARGWTQTELAQRLEVSQGRLSQLERGEGSFTAEQLLTVLELFNVGLAEFAIEPVDPEVELQNVLARLGANHLREARVLTSARLEEVTAAVRETLVSANAARLVTALAPVLVTHVDAVSFEKLALELERVGLAHRLAWVAENVVEAIRATRAKLPPRHQRALRRAQVVLESFLENVGRHLGALPATDILDSNIRSTASRHSVQAGSSEPSKRWHVVTAIQPGDFANALEAALAD